MTPTEALRQADLDPTDAAIFAYLSACALACIYDGGTMALARRRWPVGGAETRRP